MSIEKREFPQFFVTSPAECPYLPDHEERKIFTHLTGSDAAGLHDILSRNGFRRSQAIAYKPSCRQCSKCVSVRIRVDEFELSKSHKRIIRKNRFWHGHMVDPVATKEQFSLFSDYIKTRHGDGGMAEMSALDYAAMVEETPVETKLIEYRNEAEYRLDSENNQQGRLLAVSLTDILSDGLSMIYSFFDPVLSPLSPGSYMILDHIERARQMGLPYIYLGYWVEGSQKMAYKSRFLPQDRLGEHGWAKVD